MIKILIEILSALMPAAQGGQGQEEEENGGDLLKKLMGLLFGSGGGTGTGGTQNGIPPQDVVSLTRPRYTWN